MVIGTQFSARELAVSTAAGRRAGKRTGRLILVSHAMRIRLGTGPPSLPGRVLFRGLRPLVRDLHLQYGQLGGEMVDEVAFPRQFPQVGYRVRPVGEERLGGHDGAADR